MGCFQYCGRVLAELEDDQLTPIAGNGIEWE